MKDLRPATPPVSDMRSPSVAEDREDPGGSGPGPRSVGSVVVVCHHLARPHGSIDLDSLRDELLARAAGTGEPMVAEIVGDLCSRPEAVMEPARRMGPRTLVLALCDRRAALSEYRAWAGRAGVNWFRVDAIHAGLMPVHADGAPDLERLALLLTAVARRLSVPAPSGVRARRPLALPDRFSRRALFEIPPLTFAAAASIVPDLCSAPRCSLCLLSCPREAIVTGHGGRLSIVADRCDGCGVCVSTCPAEAVDLAGSSLREHEAFLEVLFGSSSASGPTPLSGILFACAPDTDRRAGSVAAPVPLPPGWFVMTVPCVAMVTPGWILQAIAVGAPAVALLSCAQPVPVGTGVSLRERVEFCRDLLRAVAVPDAEQRVSLLPAEPRAAGARLATLCGSPATQPAAGPGGRLTLREPEATVEALLRLAPAPDHVVTVAGQASPLGQVFLDEPRCTSCGACALVCPTGALTLERGVEGSSLVLDSRRCIPCWYCAAVCPERALDVQPGVDIAVAGDGRRVLKRDGIVCRHCGGQGNGLAIVNHVRRLVPPSLGMFLDDAAEACADCLVALMAEREMARDRPRELVAGGSAPGGA